MDNTAINTCINETLEDIVQVLTSFEEDEINEIPFEGSWTPAQVAQHVILSVSMFEGLLNGPEAETERDPAENVPTLKSLFLNFDHKLHSPDFIIPAEKDYKKEELLHTLAGLQTKLNQTIPLLNLSKTCTGAALPNMSYLTRTEVVYFILYHTQRHVHQLKNIYSKTGNL